MGGNNKLTDKQERFCKEYVIDNNATQAAIRTGYSKNTAESQGSRLLMNAKVKTRITELQGDISEITKIDAAYVRERHVAIDQMDFIDILEDDGSLKPIRDWPKIFRQYLNSFEIAELWEGRRDEKEQIGVLKKIKWPDKMKNLELLGKHVDVQAYKERVEQSGELDVNVSDKAKRRKRIEELLSKK
jgi:phage terminase small subunit